MSEPDDLAGGVLAGDRLSLARAITLVESRHQDHRRQAATLLDRLLPSTGRAIRVGISGPPGVGKSSLMEALGVGIADTGRKVAVLAIDPSSQRNRGSILGDKTRMEDLARHPNAYIRPSPSSGTLGGVAPRTREAILVCEAAGFETVFVETVGVGQSETEVADMVDVFVLLVQPGGGDELQGIKRGVMELADLVVITKADGSLRVAADHSASDHRAALSLLQPKRLAWRTEVLLCSAVERRGVVEVADAIDRCHHALLESGELAAQRARQATAWFRSELSGEVMRRFRAQPGIEDRLDAIEDAVAHGALSPISGVSALLDVD